MCVALQQISPHYRDVLILYEMHDLSYLEIAQICDIDLGTVRSRLSRARARLLGLLKGDLAPTHAHNAEAYATEITSARLTEQTPGFTREAHS